MCEDAINDLVKCLFQANYEYKVLKCNVTEYKEKDIKCDMEIRVNVTNEANVKLFFSAHSTVTVP